MEQIGHWIDGKRVAGTSGRHRGRDEPPPRASTGTGGACLRIGDGGRRRLGSGRRRKPGGATNPQKRARVLMEMVRLINRDMDKLAEAISREHGKTFPRRQGRRGSAGLRVIEFCIGAPHLLKGEFTDSAGPGIDMYSMRQPLGVVAGITPFNFPAMIPLWKLGPALASGNAMILKPSERDPSCPMMLAELLQEAGLPDGVFQVINGDKEAVDAILDNTTIQAVGFVGSTPIAQYIYETCRPDRQARAVLRRCQEPHDHHARRRHGPCRRCAWWRGLRRRGRALHGDLGCGARGRGNRRPADRKAGAADRGAEGRPPIPRAMTWISGLS